MKAADDDDDNNGDEDLSSPLLLFPVVVGAVDPFINLNKASVLFVSPVLFPDDAASESFAPNVLRNLVAYRYSATVPTNA